MKNRRHKLKPKKVRNDDTNSPKKMVTVYSYDDFISQARGDIEMLNLTALMKITYISQTSKKMADQLMLTLTDCTQEDGAIESAMIVSAVS